MSHIILCSALALRAIQMQFLFCLQVICQVVIPHTAYVPVVWAETINILRKKDTSGQYYHITLTEL